LLGIIFSEIWNFTSNNIIWVFLHCDEMCFQVYLLTVRFEIRARNSLLRLSSIVIIIMFWCNPPPPSKPHVHQAMCVFTGLETKSGEFTSPERQPDDQMKNANGTMRRTADTIFENVEILQVWNFSRRKRF